ncbi:peptidyl-prolyl cis-trans isomerase SurA [Sinosporangium album]|uniref:Peptidyl-prolyl cis-trans isomerase SurA n=1 Tax=Sinosporangium album TaxID=504805 RepID=A0A1G8AJR7_9ACTN|nr:hypothetical protein [Sinosporangium album]SDH21083.1 peptidyl-prolyl cis-trans isomerase SurA [Sinosporangium album]
MKSIRIALGATLAGVALTACAPVQAGAAAVVGDQRVSASDLSNGVAEFETALAKAKIQPEQIQITSPTQSVLFQLASMKQFSQIIRNTGTSVSPGEVDAFIGGQGGPQQVEQALLTRGVPPSKVRNWVEVSIGVNKLLAKYGGGTDEAALNRGQQRLATDIEKVAISFNPRFGAFDAEKGFVDSARFGAVPQTKS